MADLELRELVLARLAADTGSASGAEGHTLDSLLDAMGLPSEWLSERVELVAALDRLQEQRLVESTTTTDGGTADDVVRFRLTEAGRSRAQDVRTELLETRIEAVDGDDRQDLTVETAADRLERPPVAIVAATTSDGVYYHGAALDRGFVGREAALDTAHSQLQSARDGDGRVLLLIGPPGVGKTTLADRLLTEAREMGLAVFRARVRGEGASAYQPVRDLVAGLRGNPFVEARPAVDEPDAFRAQKTALFHDLTELLAPPDDEAAPARVVYIDDLHLADAGTFAYVEYLLEEVDGRRLLVVGSYRPAELPDRVPITPATTEDAPVTHLELEPFDRENTRALLVGQLERRGLPESFVDVIHDRTGGNPLFVEATVESLLETEHLEPALDVYPESPADVDVPGEVQETINHHVGQYPSPARELLRWAALLGEQFDADLLAAVTDLPDTQFRTYLELFVHGTVFDRSEDHLAFRSEVVREALLEEWAGDEQRDRHEEVADVLAARAGDDPATIAYHYQQADDHERAIAAYRRAAEDATDVYAHETAIDHLRAALSLARETGDGEMLAELATDVASVHGTVGAYGDAQQYAQFAREQAVTDDQRRRALAQLSAVTTAQGDHERAIELVAEGLELAADGDVEDEVTCLLLGHECSAQKQQGQYEAARETAQRRRRIAGELGDDDQLAESFDVLGKIAFSRGSYDRAREYHEKSLEIRREVGDRTGIAKSLKNLGIVAGEQGEYERAREYFEEGLAIERDVGDRHGVAKGLNNLGIVTRNRDEYDRAREYYEESLAIHREIGDRHGLARNLNNLGEVARWQGDHGRAREFQEESLAVYREVGDRHGIAKSLSNLALVVHRRGDHGRAREFQEESLAIFRELGARHEVAKCLGHIGSITKAQGDHDPAADYFERAVEAADDVADDTQATACLAHRAALAFETGDPDLGVVTADRALDRFESEKIRVSPHGLDPLGALQELVEAASGDGHHDRAREWCHRTLSAEEGTAVADEKQRRWFERKLQQFPPTDTER